MDIYDLHICWNAQDRAAQIDTCPTCGKSGPRPFIHTCRKPEFFANDPVAGSNEKDAFIRSLPEMMRGIRQWPDDVRAFIALPRTSNPSVRNHILNKLDELEKMADAIIAEAKRLGGE